MVHRCIVPGCQNESGSDAKQRQVAFFGFPGDLSRRDSWERRINRVDKNGVLLKAGVNDRICSDHFGSDSFLTMPGSGKRPLLTKFAIPTQHLSLDLNRAIALLPPEPDGQFAIPESISREFPSEVVIQAPDYLNHGIEGAKEDPGTTELVTDGSKRQSHRKRCFSDICSEKEDQLEMARFEIKRLRAEYEKLKK